ncbi:MAG: cobyrinate a,c-diamide synthase, partial [Alicyclobacillus sp.]|nr:cobyrinate a,c-diamide synthase [Alicyclobacillus sp.]
MAAEAVHSAPQSITGVGTMGQRRLVIAGSSSGVGKTTVTLGLMAALRRRGMIVQGFKVGPDYIDPGHHARATGRPSRNLDTWMMGPAAVREVFQRGSEGADICVVEGVMGLYDGKDPLSNAGSTAEVSRILKAPVLLVIDVSSMARSAAALVHGFLRFDPEVRVAGVIANRAGGRGHFELVKAAVEQTCGLPVAGYLMHQQALHMPERHLGLVPAAEEDAESAAHAWERLADAVEATIDIDRVVRLAEQAPPLPEAEPVLFTGSRREPEVNIAIARDRAFHFYYPENLELLEWHGARLLAFRPLEGDPVPEEAHGLYWGGGFPEEFAEQLSRQEEVRRSVRRAVEAGMPVFAECGGFMYLMDSMADGQGHTHRMAGVVPATARMQARLAAFGYREVTALTDTPVLR